MIIELILYLFCFIFFYSLGYLYNRYLLKSYISSTFNSKSERILVKLFLGVFLTITIYSVLRTQFVNTYVIFFVFFMVLPFLKLKRQVQLVEKIRFKEIISKKSLVFLVILLLFFVFHHYLFTYEGKTPFYDFLFLAKISTGLVNNGVESIFSATSSYYNTSVNPYLYHYFDLWFTGILSKTFNYSEYNILLNICFPFFHFIVFTLLFVIVKYFFKKFYLSILLSFGLLFGSEFFFKIDGPLYELIEMYRGLPYSLFYKLLIIYIFVLFSYFFYLKKLLVLSVISICALLIVYPTTIPAFFFLANVILFYDLIFKRKLNYYPLPIFGVILYVVIFQKIFKYDEVSNVQFHLYTIKQYLILILESFIKIFIEHYLVIVLGLYLSFKCFKKVVSNRAIQFSFFSILGSILYVYFNPPGVMDINQVINNISPVLVLVITVELVHIISSKYILNTIIAVTIFVGIINVFKNYTDPNVKLLGKKLKHSQEFQKSTIRLMLERNESNFCSISKIQPRYDFYHTSMCFNYILVQKNINTPLEINVLFEPFKFIRNYSKVNLNYPPNQYFSNHNDSVESVYNYLRMNNFKYVLLERTACSNNDKLLSFLKTKCSKIIEDKNTKDAIFQLN